MTALLPEELRNLADPQTLAATDCQGPETDRPDRVRGERDSHSPRSAARGRAAILQAESVVISSSTSPPYWTLKEYRRSEGQLGFIEDYEDFLGELDKVWECCYRALVPGGRLICVVGDVCLSRRNNGGGHMVMPLHASIQEHCRRMATTTSLPIIWHKIANAAHEVENGSSFLGKPYEPNAVIKNDIEYILMQASRRLPQPGPQRGCSA